MTSPPRTPGTPCVGCLGNRQCWVCLGAGRSERADGGFDACLRCSGTGRCHLCRPAKTVDLAAGPSLPGEAADRELRLDDGPLRLDSERIGTLLP